MVEEQLAKRGINNVAVLDAMRRVPRHEFVAESQRSQAYEDKPLGIGLGQTISQPYMVALMTSLLNPKSGSRVLEIGCGSGYQTAVLCELGCEVVAIERHKKLASAARDRLQRLGFEGFRVLAGDGSRGYPDGAPYDGILVAAASPKRLVEVAGQLAAGGRMVCPTGEREMQRLEVIRMGGKGPEVMSSAKCRFVPLIGAEGWPD